MKLKKLLRTLFLCCLTLPVFSQNTPVSMNGKLKLKGIQLSSECGNPVQLRGMSTHGVQWFGNCINNSSFTALKNDWKCDIVRLALYVDEGGYTRDPAGWKTKIDTWVDQIGALGMYCLIDWHILNPGDPNIHTAEAKEFFGYMSAKHKGKKHVLYEICNEPNGVDWGTVKNYANQVIPVIRANDPETIIIVGTPFWSGKPGDVVSGGPLTGANAYNVMYSFHFYAASHSSYRPEVQRAAGSIPIFSTEWGLSDASGNGAVSISEGQLWMDIFNGNNSGNQKISWCNWSFADKAESSGSLTPGACASSSWNSTTSVGNQVKTWISSPAKSFTACQVQSVVTASISSPLNNAAFNLGAPVSFTATASTTQGSIAKVEYYEGTTLLGSATSAPYTFTTSALTAGNHKITAKATDASGSSGTSTEITVKINASVVTATITSPANNTSIVTGNPLVVNAGATTTNGTISKLEIYVDDVLKETDLTSPYQFSITGLSIGNHVIMVKAHDTNTSTGTASITVTVSNTPVKVSITGPVSGDLALGADLNLTASATTTGGNITKVEFYIDDELVNTDNSAPFEYKATGLASGSHKVMVKAYDSNNNSASSEVRTFNFLTPVYKTNTAPVIDGSADAVWNNASLPSSALTKTITGTVADAADLSGNFKTLWDNNYLYVLGSVKDNVKTNDSPEAYNDDAVEVYLDVNNDKAATYGSNDAQYTFGWDDEATINTTPSGRTTTGISFKIKETADGYTFEARIPWTNLSGNPVAGQKLGFEFMVNDDDNGTDRDGKLSWNAATDDAWQNPSLFGTVVLQDALPCVSPGNAGPVTGNSKVCQLASEQIYSVQEVADAVTYKWSLPSGFTIASGENTRQIKVTVAENAVSGVVKVTPENNCGAGQSMSKDVVVETCTVAGLDTESGSAGFRVYPNPFENSFTIAAGSGLSIQKLELSDIEGQVAEVIQHPATTGEIRIGQNLPSGQYILRIITNDKVFTRSLIKLK